MEDSLRLCASAFVRNKGKTVFTENDFLMGISMDLHWMAYSDSKVLLSAIIAEGLFEKSGEFIRAAQDIANEDVPVAYKPSPALVERIRAMKGGLASAPVPAPPKPEPAKEEVPAQDAADPGVVVPEDMMPVLMGLAVDMGMERRDFIMSSNAIQRSLNVATEVAALFVLRDAGVDISDLADRVYESIRLR